MYRMSACSSHGTQTKHGVILLPLTLQEDSNSFEVQQILDHRERQIGHAERAGHCAEWNVLSPGEDKTRSIIYGSQRRIYRMNKSG